MLPYVNEAVGNTYFLLGADRVWPHQMFDIAKPLIEKLGGKIVGTQYTQGTETDFTPLIKQVAAAKPKVLLFALKGDGIDFIRQADDQGLFKDTTVAFWDCPRSISASSREGPEHDHRGAVAGDQRCAGDEGLRRQGARCNRK